MNDQTLFERLISLVEIEPDTGCHTWQGRTDGKADPYGRTTFKGQTIGAHLAMWRAMHGSIRKGYEIDHKCCNRLCVNIDHLQQVTPKKNAILREKRKLHKGNVFKCLQIK